MARKQSGDTVSEQELLRRVRAILHGAPLKDTPTTADNENWNAGLGGGGANARTGPPEISNRVAAVDHRRDRGQIHRPRSCRPGARPPLFSRMSPARDK
jgi:hypothetical protein